MTYSREKKSKEHNSLGALYDKRDRALGGPPETESVAEEDELSMALDALTIAHFAATFEFVSGAHEWL